MALSPNYGWSEPDNSSLVKNGAADIRTLGDAIDTSLWNVGFGQAGKNKIVNGDFGIWQRGTSFSNPSSSAYTGDRWQVSHNGTGATRTISQQTFTPGTAPVAGYEANFFYRYALTVVGTGNTYQLIQQPIEDVRTFAGQTVTLSFWAKAGSSATIQTDFDQYFGSGGSSDVYSAQASHSVTTSWTRFSQTVTLGTMTGKTIGAGSFLAPRILPAAATTITLDIWGVQLEYGSKATPFETATGTLQGELAACQRYYYRHAEGASQSIGIGTYYDATTLLTLVQLPVTMRTTPTVDQVNQTNYFQVVRNSGTDDFNLFTSISRASNKAVTIDCTSNISGTAGQAGIVMTNNASSYLGFIAEL
jgi:hypothetical protein